ncbi:unnamed protein product [Dibothriocephalus latus]|uniref:Uncharacterized protein n=1 Tax=Dibothriocephalus latus TaxID=60516 RepID=A0A3P7LFQ1_DIBLA|nr:unnamed protein product [Dibothriocephalus latus]
MALAGGPFHNDCAQMSGQSAACLGNAASELLTVGMSAEAFQQTPITATTRRRVLATRQLNVSEFASSLPTQNNLKISLRLASKKVTSVVLILTLHGLMLRTGEAT